MLFPVVCSVFLLSAAVLLLNTNYLRNSDWLLKISNQSAKGAWPEDAPQTAKWSTPPEGALTTELENDVRLFVLFCSTYLQVKV